MTEPIKRYILVEVTEENPDGIRTDSGCIRRAIHESAESHGIPIREMIYMTDRRTPMASSVGFYHTLSHVMKYTMKEGYRLAGKPHLIED